MQRKSTQQKHVVIDHLAPQVTVSNHLHFEPHQIGRHAEQPAAGSASARQTHSNQTLSRRHSARYRDGQREEKKQKEIERE